mmetsp:Transcript_6073/g.23000  ORF Transcript_6073/g.23000 Transcript_6073/m.23000 type:complete len:187 (+) Transcript_6073:3078-3638(+)
MVTEIAHEQMSVDVIMVSVQRGTCQFLMLNNSSALIPFALVSFRQTRTRVQGTECARVSTIAPAQLVIRDAIARTSPAGMWIHGINPHAPRTENVWITMIASAMQAIQDKAVRTFHVLMCVIKIHQFAQPTEFVLHQILVNVNQNIGGPDVNFLSPNAQLLFWKPQPRWVPVTASSSMPVAVSANL